MNINTNYNKLHSNYLFTDIEKRTAMYREQHPEARLLRMGVGDVSLPLPETIVKAIHDAADELAHKNTFRGYGPEEGYHFLREKIVVNDFLAHGIQLDIDEVFISEGAGSDLGNLSELFAQNNKVAVLDPVYPAYVDANVMAGRAGEWIDGRWSNLVYLPCSAENNFVPSIPDEHVDIIYLCFPNNPTGTVLTREQLRQWVEYAHNNSSIIIFDAAYEAFITENDVPHSIYEIEGAKEVAIEVRSFSKSAGFTSVRCGYTVVPKATGLQHMWYRRQCTKYNGTSYISQRAAEATYTAEGRAGIMDNIRYYRKNADLLTCGLRQLGYAVYGGVNSPYIWLKTPDKIDSWTFFDILLNDCRIVCTPGVGFGKSGEGYVRFSAFASRQDTCEAIQRIEKL